MTSIIPFGDHKNDGIIQMSFTLPVESSNAGKIAAKSLAEKMGVLNPEVIHDISLSTSATYYIIYGKTEKSIDISEIKDIEVSYEIHTKENIERALEEKYPKGITVIGASTGTDTHSVGIDAILNHKGYNGNYGMEAYKGFNITNLGSQVSNEELITESIQRNVDVILVSQTVTQQGLHLDNLTELVDLLEAESVRDRFLLICGGPRITLELAQELGFDMGFSKGTYAKHVASYIIANISKIKK